MLHQIYGSLRQVRLGFMVCRQFSKMKHPAMSTNIEVFKRSKNKSVQSGVNSSRDENRLYAKYFHTLSKRNEILAPAQQVSTGNAFVSDSSSKQNFDDTNNNLSLYQRFKMAYKKHGKTLIAVHVATSCVWYSAFYYTVQSGVDVVSWLEHMGASDTILKPFKVAGLGDFAVAYLMYKLATPARYTVTLGGTNLAIKSLKKRGYIEQVSQEDKIRSLMKESREVLKEKKDDWKEKIQKQK
ncbi:protein FAM210A-like [Tubulanus polymorphus]|uniref:protein FAM210A-like n=1 Tax=Tubulanus polymorphus TaxID=672921 RepID=UPI003DA56791